jgi:hypothetical protein
MLIHVDILVGQWILCVSVHSYADEWQWLSMHDYELIFRCDGIGVRKWKLKNESFFFIPRSAVYSRHFRFEATWIKLSYCLVVILMPGLIFQSCPVKFWTTVMLHSLVFDASAFVMVTVYLSLRRTARRATIYRLRATIYRLFFQHFQARNSCKYYFKIRGLPGRKHTALPLQVIVEQFCLSE